MNVDPNDIALAVQVIDIASARGALRGEELATVGMLRNKFVKLLEEAQQTAPTEEPA